MLTDSDVTKLKIQSSSERAGSSPAFDTSKPSRLYREGFYVETTAF